LQRLRTHPDNGKPSSFAASCHRFRCSAVTRSVRAMPMYYVLHGFAGVG
jgi:hypothetical protein